MFKKAERKKAYLKIAMCGVSGSGKTYSALQLARGLGNNIAMIDTENGSGELYSDLCSYDICSISAPFEHTKYIKAIKEAEADGYDVLIIDSLTQAWNGAGGLLEKQEQVGKDEVERQFVGSVARYYAYARTACTGYFAKQDTRYRHYAQ